MIRVAVLVAMTLLATAARAQDAGVPSTATEARATEPPPPAPVIDTTPPNPPRRPVFKQAWFWGVLLSSFAVVAAGVAIGVTFGR